MPLNLTRSLLVVLIPGLIAVAPWLIWAVRQYDDVGALYSRYKEPVAVGVFAIIVVVGAMVEIVNSWIETSWDESRESEFGVATNWYDYLARSFQTEPVGYGYIAKMVTTMYFELALVWALPLFVVGLVVLNVTSATVSWFFVVVVVVVGAGLSSMAYFSAKESHLVLCKTRLEINKRANG